MASIDVDVDDIISSMTSWESQEMADALYEDGYVAKGDPRSGVDEDGNSTEFDFAVSKLIGNGWRLSKEDEETILQITNKIIV